MCKFCNNPGINEYFCQLHFDQMQLIHKAQFESISNEFLIFYIRHCLEWLCQYKDYTELKDITLDTINIERELNRRWFNDKLLKVIKF